MIRLTAERIAQVRTESGGVAITTEQLLEAARENASKLFGITLEGN